MVTVCRVRYTAANILCSLMCAKSQQIEAPSQVETGNCRDDSIGPKAVLGVGKAFENWLGEGRGSLREPPVIARPSRIVRPSAAGEERFTAGVRT